MSAGTLRRSLIFWTLFIGLGAVAGGSAMLLDPSGGLLGMGGMLPYFQVLPLAEYLYQDLRFPGIALLIVNGATQLAAAGLLRRRRRGAAVWSGCCGVILMLWICIQFYMFPFNLMSTAYFLFGALEAANGFWLARKERGA